jgi:UBX domain-containing protein 1
MLTASLQAQQFLEANRWDLSGAATEYFTAQEEGIAGAQGESDEESEELENYTGPRTLDGRPAPAAIPTVGSSSSAAPPPRRGVAGIRTLGSLNQDEDDGHGHDHDHDEDSDDEHQPRNLFTGGEKSGLAVQDPNRRSDPKSIINDLLKKAKAWV